MRFRVLHVIILVCPTIFLFPPGKVFMSPSSKGEGVILPLSFCLLPFCLCHIALESVNIQVIQP